METLSWFPISTLAEESKLKVEYLSKLLFWFRINFSVFCAGHPLDNIPPSWIKGNTTPRVTRQWCRTVPSLQLDQQNTEWSKMVETSARKQHRRANRIRLDTWLESAIETGGVPTVSAMRLLGPLRRELFSYVCQKSHPGQVCDSESDYRDIVGLLVFWKPY